MLYNNIIICETIGGYDAFFFLLLLHSFQSKDWFPEIFHTSVLWPLFLLFLVCIVIQIYNLFYVSNIIVASFYTRITHWNKSLNPAMCIRFTSFQCFPVYQSLFRIIFYNISSLMIRFRCNSSSTYSSVAPLLYYYYYYTLVHVSL
jgi:hypothetical protein